MWERLEQSLQAMIDTEEWSLSLTPKEKTSDRLMICVRKKTYADVLDLMTKIEDEALNTLRRDYRRNGHRVFSLS